MAGPSSPAEAGISRPRHRAQGAVWGDDADAVVAGVGDVDGTVRPDRETAGAVEPGRWTATAPSGEKPASPVPMTVLYGAVLHPPGARRGWRSRRSTSSRRASKAMADRRSDPHLRWRDPRRPCSRSGRCRRPCRSSRSARRCGGCVRRRRPRRCCRPRRARRKSRGTDWRPWRGRRRPCPTGTRRRRCRGSSRPRSTRRTCPWRVSAITTRPTGVDRDVCGVPQVCLGRWAFVAAVGARAVAGDGADDAGLQVDAADALVSGVGEVDLAVGAQRLCRWGC